VYIAIKSPGANEGKNNPTLKRTKKTCLERTLCIQRELEQKHSLSCRDQLWVAWHPTKALSAWY